MGAGSLWCHKLAVCLCPDAKPGAVLGGLFKGIWGVAG